MAGSSSNYKKKLKPLPSDLRSVVRSGIAVTSVAQCVEELVFNAIDAEASTIKIGVNIDQFNVRTEDDGHGINEKDLGAAGERYSTSKCHSLDDLARLKSYGFRGEALASIINVSSTVDIITRPKDTAGIELKKKFEEGQEAGFVEKCNTKNMKPGTVIVIGRLLSKLPVRQNRIDKSIQLEEVKNCLEKIALINPRLNIELRNEKQGVQLLDFKTSDSYSEAFDKLFKDRLGFEVNFVEEYYLHRNLFFQLNISKKFFKTKNHQFVYVNNRFIQRNRIYKWLGRSISKLGEQRHDSSSPKGDKYPIFIFNISCPLREYDVTLEPKKQVIEFKNWEDIQNGIEGLVTKLKMTNSFGNSTTRKSTSSEVKSSSFVSSHNVKGAVHSRFAARPEEKLADRGKDSASDRGSVSRSSTSGGPSSSKRSLSRSGGHNSSHVVDVRAVRRKRKLENSLSKMEPPQMLYSIGNKPRLTVGIFDQFKDWKGELKSPCTSDKAKRFKGQERHQVSTTTTVDPNATTSSAAVVPVPNIDVGNCEAVVSPSANSVYQWKIRRFIQDFENPNETTGERMDDTFQRQLEVGHNGSAVNSLDGLSDTVSTFQNKKAVDDTTGQMKILSKTEQYLKDLVEEKWKLQPSRKSVMDKIIAFWQLTSKKDKKAVPKILKQDKRKPHPNPKFSRAGEQNKQQQSLEVPPLDKCPEVQDNLSDSGLAVTRQNSDFHLLSKSNNLQLPVQDGPFKVPFSISGPGPVPPLLNLFPYQKSYSGEWNDSMLSGDYSSSSDSDLFPSDNWSVEIVLDQNGQEWLQTVDERGRKLFISLTSGQSSYDMINICDRVKVTADEMKKCNPSRYRWLRKQFPRGFQQFLNTGERDVQRQGDLSKIDGSIIKDSLLHCLQDQQQPHSKWNESELESVSKYFNETNITTATFRSVSVNSNTKLSNIQCWKNMTSGTSSFRFSREDFEHTHVIGQLDKKFILAGIRKSQTENMTLVIFDQHAVHERIRLEDLISGLYRKSTNGKKYVRTSEVMPPFPINLADSEVRLMQSHAEIFHQAGIEFEVISSTCIRIKTVPNCFLEKSAAEAVASRQSVFLNLVCNLIKDLISHIMGTKGASLVVLPKTIHEVLCSQACHGAIKFGDQLDIDTCRKLITSLRKCKSLFQCAHGRPTVVPLIKGQDLARTSSTAIMDRPATATMTEDHTSLPAASHQECSGYFCDLDEDDDKESLVSAYFTNANAANANFLANDEKLEPPSVLPAAFKLRNDSFVPQPLNIFHPSTEQLDNDDEEDSESPYFFKGPF